MKPIRSFQKGKKNFLLLTLNLKAFLYWSNFKYCWVLLNICDLSHFRKCGLYDIDIVQHLVYDLSLVYTYIYIHPSSANYSCKSVRKSIRLDLTNWSVIWFEWQKTEWQKLKWQKSEWQKSECQKLEFQKYTGTCNFDTCSIYCDITNWSVIWLEWIWLVSL